MKEQSESVSIGQEQTALIEEKEREREIKSRGEGESECSSRDPACVALRTKKHRPGGSRKEEVDLRASPARVGAYIDHERVHDIREYIIRGL